MASLDQLMERHRKATSGTRWRTTAGPFYMYHWLYRLGFHWVEEWTKLRDYGSQGADWGDPVRKQLRWTVIPLTPWIAGPANWHGPKRKAQNTGQSSDQESGGE